MFLWDSGEIRDKCGRTYTLLESFTLYATGERKREGVFRIQQWEPPYTNDIEVEKIEAPILFYIESDKFGCSIKGKVIQIDKIMKCNRGFFYVGKEIQ